MKRINLVLLSALGLVLAAAAGVQLYQARHATAVAARPALRAVLPADLPGWNSQELPLAETEETRNATVDILKFDDYFSRAYRQNGTEVTVYVAYWRPDKMPPRMVGRHTPDRCWIENGWNCESRQRAVTLTGTSGSLKPAELGTYALKERARFYVAFWHLVGDESYAYGPDQANMVAFAPVKDLFTFGLNQRKEQFFIRLASNVPLAQVWTNPGFRELLASLEKLGLRPETPRLQVATAP